MLRRGYSPANSYLPNLAPMVDVVMVILVFFMLGTSLVIREGVLPTELPSQIGPENQAKVTIIPPVRITIRRRPDGEGCTIRVMDRDLASGSFQMLEAFMRQKRQAGADPNGPVLISAGAGVLYQNVISTMDACVRAGFRNIHFAVNLQATAGIE